MLNTLPMGPPEEAQSFLLLDAQNRDVVTARRVHLLRILWRERYLTREGLVRRVEMVVGRACFGEKSCEDNFYRDLRVVKNAFKYSGHQLKYSRRREQSGYYLAGEPALHPDEEKAIQAALRELDPHQIEIYKRISPAQKFFRHVLSQTWPEMCQLLRASRESRVEDLILYKVAFGRKPFALLDTGH